MQDFPATRRALGDAKQKEQASDREICAFEWENNHEGDA